jgi:hypothetical protein
MADAERQTRVNLEQALLDPGSVFASPEDVLLDERLSKQQKIEILRRWEYEAKENSVALNEGMPDGNGDLLQRILSAIRRLSVSDI